MINRRNFIKNTTILGVGLPILSNNLPEADKQLVMTVNGPIHPRDMQFTLTHEHILADFIGAEKYSRDRYNADEVFNTALPYLMEVKRKGCTTFVDCAPAYLGRDVKLFKRLADATGLQIITNTGYYGAVGEKFLPKHVYTESAEQIAARWITEWSGGIEGTEIKPGFIKTSVDKAPLTPAQYKIIEAAAITHLATGLTIAIHTGNGEANKEELEILKKHGVSPAARIWVHAQNEPDKTYHIEAAKAQSWISFDDVNPETIQLNVDRLQNMKSNNLLNRVLVSQDSGWYHVGEPNGGKYKDYNSIFDLLIPELKKHHFTQKEIDTIFITNPAKAFAINVRKL
jgi:predicted metal-dependent phosphotriesterase family hydrolase